jgi:hypothetical protein
MTLSSRLPHLEQCILWCRDFSKPAYHKALWCQCRRQGFAGAKYSIAHGESARMVGRMLSEDSFQYALENTQVLRAPHQRIETFGQTTFRFFLVTELMDSAHQIRIRDGHFHAERPQIVTPAGFQRTLAEGFGERAEEFMDWLRLNAGELAVLKYGFQFRKTHVCERVVQSSLEEVVARLEETVDRSEDPLSAIIQGVDEGWEVCLLKFAIDLIQSSAPRNADDFRRRGLF